MSGTQVGLGLIDSSNEERDVAGAATMARTATQQNSQSVPGLVCNLRRTTGMEPQPLVGATTTILGDKLYVFGGRMITRSRPQLTSDLYELDLIQRHWMKVEVSGEIPAPRYFHTMCALGDNKLVCYGGMSLTLLSSKDPPATVKQTPQESPSDVVVMSDIHIFDVSSRAWKRVLAKDSPQGRYAHCATILPSSAYFTSANAPLSAIHHNPSSSNPHQGTIGVDIDGFGGAEMVVVGGQDRFNHYIEQISVFNLRSLKWTSTAPLGRSCGAYRSVVAPLVGMNVSEIGALSNNGTMSPGGAGSAVKESSMLIYSNYNFLDVKLELQVRLPDGRLIEKPMHTKCSPPGLRFPSGGVIDEHFMVSGTYLTSSKQEYSLWALNLKTLTWGRFDVSGSIFRQGSWNRGVLWERRNAFVILGHRKRSLMDDYNHRRINFAHMCIIELEAFGLYNNPCRTSPTSNYVSVSAPSVPASVRLKPTHPNSGGRPCSFASDELGRLASSMVAMADMEIQALGGERIPVNSRILARRWGPYFIHLLRQSCEYDSVAFRSETQVHPNRNSSVTITPSLGVNSNYSNASTLVNQPTLGSKLVSNVELPSAHSIAPGSRSRVLYLPHTFETIQLFVYFLYMSSLPPTRSPLCTPQILCSLLQLARPYQVDGLLEATVERLHKFLDGRNAAAVFNAAAMAAGGGRGTGFLCGTPEALNSVHTVAESAESSSVLETQQGALASDSADAELGTAEQRRGSDSVASKDTSFLIHPHVPGHRQRNSDQDDSVSNHSASSSMSVNSSANSEELDGMPLREIQAQRGAKVDDPLNSQTRQIWTGGISSVIGLQKRGLRGLMEGRRLRERTINNNSNSFGTTMIGLGVGEIQTGGG